MKKVITVLLMVCFIALFWQCSEKEVIEVLGYSPPQPSSSPSLVRSNLKSADGDFLPGYQNGKILSDRITLDWQQNNDGDFLSYRIIRNNTVAKIIKNRTVTSFTDSGSVFQPIFQNTFYNYKVAVLNSRGVALTDTVRVKTPRFQAPSNLNRDFNTPANTVRLTWFNNAEPGIRFRVYRKLTTQPESAYQQVGTSSVESYTDSNVPSGSYNYRVTAFFNALEETPPSFPITVFVN